MQLSAAQPLYVSLYRDEEELDKVIATLKEYLSEANGNSSSK